MTNVEMLRKKISDSGLKISYLAKQLGITPQGLYLKLNGTNQFKALEIQILCRILGITDSEEMKEIFFATEVDEKSTCEETT